MNHASDSLALITSIFLHFLVNQTEKNHRAKAKYRFKNIRKNVEKVISEEEIYQIRRVTP